MDAATQTSLSWIHELVDSPSSPAEEESLRSNHEDETGKIEAPITTLQELADELSDSSEEEDDDFLQQAPSQFTQNNDEKLPSLHKTVPSSSHNNLPWPSILQYMRETESEASKYFGLQTTIPATTAGEGNTASSVATVEESHENSQRNDCQFCGQLIKPLSLLPDSLNKEPDFCCEDLKQYIILVALYTKRIHDFKLHSKPGRITLASQKELKVKKTAQERALERMRRKQKWEETSKKLILLQNSSVSAMSHQTKVIKFSLSSPNCVNTGWVTATTQENSTKSTVKKSRRLPFPTPLSPLVKDVTETDEEREEKEDRSLEIMHYNPKQIFSLVLPDRTGQTYYPSGNIAILHAVLHSSIHSYILFNDRPNSDVIGYVDNLGRAWLKGDTYSLRFVSTLKEGFVMEGSGRTRLWYWNDHALYSLYLPLVFRINQYLSLRFNNHDDITICLSGQQKQHKYQIKRIPAKGTNNKKSTIDKETQAFRVDLEKLKYRFESHMKCFQQSIKILAEERKHKPLLPPIATGEKQLPPHRKTKSVNVSFQ